MGAEADAFIARTTGFGPLREAAYRALIDGLVSDGVWAKLDCFYILATLSETTAQLNLLSSSFTLVPHASPTFVVDQGYTGVFNSTTVYLDTQFDPTVASSPKMAPHSTHISVWSNTNQLGGVAIGQDNSSLSHIYPRHTDNNAYFCLYGNQTGIAVANSVGHYVASRTSSGAAAFYKNNSSIGGDSGENTNPVASVYSILKGTQGGTGYGGQVALASIGGGLSSTDVGNLYSRSNTYMGLLPFGADTGVSTPLPPYIQNWF